MESSPTLPPDPLETALSQRLRALYSTHLGHQPDITTCQMFGGRLAIFLENAMTQPERLLVESGHKPLAQQVRHSLDEILKPKLRQAIEEVTHCSVVDLLVAAQLESGRISIIAILAE